jgi:hypothetical protein
MGASQKVVKAPTLASFILKKPLLNSVIAVMLRAFQHLFHRPAIRLGRMEETHGLCRNTRFASFLVECNRKPLDTGFHDAVLRGRKVLRQVLMLALIGGGAWIALESARALSVF